MKIVMRIKLHARISFMKDDAVRVDRKNNDTFPFHMYKNPNSSLTVIFNYCLLKYECENHS